MIRHVSLAGVLRLHARIIEQSGGSAGIRDLGALQSSLAQPRATFGGQELYPTLPAKAAALGFSLIQNHPFVDGNKRIGHAALEVFLMMNGFQLSAPVDEQEEAIMGVAAGSLARESFSEWVEASLQAI